MTFPAAYQKMARQAIATLGGGVEVVLSRRPMHHAASLDDAPGGVALEVAAAAGAGSTTVSVRAVSPSRLAGTMIQSLVLTVGGADYVVQSRTRIPTSGTVEVSIAPVLASAVSEGDPVSGGTAPTETYKALPAKRGEAPGMDDILATMPEGSRALSLSSYGDPRPPEIGDYAGLDRVQLVTPIGPSESSPAAWRVLLGPQAPVRRA